MERFCWVKRSEEHSENMRVRGAEDLCMEATAIWFKRHHIGSATTQEAAAEKTAFPKSVRSCEVIH